MKIIDKCIEIIILVSMIVFSPFIIALGILYMLTKGFSKKCKYHKMCLLYSDKKEACNSAGEYQVDIISAIKADCYNWMEEFHDYHS